ncbi:MAG: lipopolysaccharide kinase InaA family protein [Oligosphaeraceae bacterium]
MSQDFLPFHSQGWNGLVVDEQWASLFRHFDQWLARHPGEMVVHYDSRDVRKISTDLGTVYLKDIRALTDAGYHRRDFFSWCKWVFRGSRARETWDASVDLLRRGFLCPKPLLAVRKRRGLVPRDVFISLELPLPNLWDTLPQGMPPTGLAEILAKELQKLHRAGFAHGDCILRNLCYDTQSHRIAFLDNDRTWTPPAMVRQFQQERNLAQMAYSLLKRFGEKVSLHFLESYARRAGWPSRQGVQTLLANAIHRRNRKRL